ncbi:MAG: site-specific integrase [Nocardioidaceae bacterium]|nr:site-specific integrase [Nocardioidaceae bacterium]
MASIRENRPKTAEPTWSVLYRHGNKQASKTFDNPSDARDLKVLIDQFGADEAFRMRAERAAPQGITVRDLAERWLEYKKRDLTPRAAADYRRDYYNWLDPFFGHRAAAYITEADVQTWVDRDLSRRLGAKSVGDKHAILHGMFKWASARTRGIVPHNPCKETELPKKVKTSVKGLTMAEWLALREAFYQVNEDAADLALFLASTGWRIGEATALMVRNVEDEGRMYVDVSHVNRKGSGVVAGAKSEAGFRRIDVSAECARMLRRRLIGLGPNDYVFTNSASPTGLWEPSTFRRRYWAKAVRLAGLGDRKPTPHWLRHTHVMLCHTAGMSLPEIQRRIGHEHISTTIDVYGRKLGEAAPEVMDRLDDLLSGHGRQVVAGSVIAPELE